MKQFIKRALIVGGIAYFALATVATLTDSYFAYKLAKKKREAESESDGSEPSDDCLAYTDECKNILGYCYVNQIKTVIDLYNHVIDQSESPDDDSAIGYYGIPFMSNKSLAKATAPILKFCYKHNLRTLSDVSSYIMNDVYSGLDEELA